MGNLPGRTRSTRPQDVQNRPNDVTTGQLSDGTKVNVRPDSSDGRPTLEIIPPSGPRDKIRYQ